MVKPLEEQFAGYAATDFKFERVCGLTTWEFSPVYKHQKKVDQIRATIRSAGQESGCGCIHVADLSCVFPDGSYKRPDIAIFSREPDEEEESVTLRPEAVIELISKGYEAKDVQIGVPFYILQGIPDVVVLDPYTNVVTHHHDGKTDTHASPVELTFHCGCVCTV